MIKIMIDDYLVSIVVVGYPFLVFMGVRRAKKNELYEDEKGNIYVSADKKGIYKIRFSDFR